jgi:hypothetical protein
MLSRPPAEFETLIEWIGEKAKRAFKGSVEAARTRMQYWIAESQERVANGIVGDTVPVRIDPKQEDVFHSLGNQFRGLESSGSDFFPLFEGSDAQLVTGRQKERHRHFNYLSRQAMAALGFRFADSSRAVRYWLLVLRQQGYFQPPNRWGVCKASEDFCTELETRVREAAAVVRPALQDATCNKVCQGAAGHAIEGSFRGADISPTRTEPSSPRTTEVTASRHEIKDMSAKPDPSAPTVPLITRNLRSLRLESGLSYRETAKKLWANGDHKAVFQHCQGTRMPERRTLSEYAHLFTLKLGREITVDDLKFKDLGLESQFRQALSVQTPPNTTT